MKTEKHTDTNTNVLAPPTNIPIPITIQILFILPIYTDTDTDFDTFFEYTVPSIAKFYFIFMLSVSFANLRPSFVTMTENCLIIF